jgi:hypothetical protein
VLATYCVNGVDCLQQIVQVIEGSYSLILVLPTPEECVIGVLSTQYGEGQEMNLEVLERLVKGSIP